MYPWLRLARRRLETADFEPGQRVRIEVRHGRLVITLTIFPHLGYASTFAWSIVTAPAGKRRRARYIPRLRRPMIALS
ncbi:SymE family type I addiction module toxin [Paraburkholderia sediminicola]|uniref:SymE family type I addiction module toxin n=1 Tax=Paraburkholderia sediminicola TaxID=458836 RepID=UPI0038BA5308